MVCHTHTYKASYKILLGIMYIYTITCDHINELSHRDNCNLKNSLLNVIHVHAFYNQTNLFLVGQNIALNFDNLDKNKYIYLRSTAVRQ